MDQGLSPKQVKHLYHLLTGKHIDVVPYDQIIKAPNLSIFFKHNHNSIIIFYPAMQKFDCVMGHYCSLTRIGNYYYFYDPLGYQPDEYKKFSDRSLYHENVNSLIKHFLISGLNIDYSHHKHQSRNPSMSTCGRHCVLRCVFDGSNDDYNKMIRRQSGIKRGFLDSYIHYLTTP